MADVRDGIDLLLRYVNTRSYREAKAYYNHLRSLREIIIREQYQALSQTRLDKFLKPAVKPAEASAPPSSPPPSSPPSSSQPPASPTPSTSFAGFE